MQETSVPTGSCRSSGHYGEILLDVGANSSGEGELFPVAEVCRRLFEQMFLAISLRHAYWPGAEHFALSDLCCIEQGCRWSRYPEVPDATDPTFIHNRDLEAAARLKANRRIHGSVLMFGGTRPQHPVETNVSCPTFDRLMATTDSKGKFSFSFDVSRQSDTDLTSAGCFFICISRRVSLRDSKPCGPDKSRWNQSRQN